mgnify:CR=1 FL=1
MAVFEVFYPTSISELEQKSYTKKKKLHPISPPHLRGAIEIGARHFCFVFVF